MQRWLLTCVPVVLFGCGVVQDFGGPGTDSPNGSGDGNGSSTQPPALAPADEAKASLSWQNPIPTGNDLHGIWGTADDDVWIGGAHGTIVRWDGVKARVVYEGKTDQPLYAMWGSGRNDMWIAGSSSDRGEVLHWDGAAWSSAFTLGKHPIHALWGSSSSDVWALAEPGLTYHFDGNTFHPVPICDFCEDATPAPLLRDLWGGTGGEVWAVGEEGAIFRTEGMAWTKEIRSAPGLADPFATDNAYRGVWGSAPNDAWAVYVAAGPGRTHRQVGFSHWDGTAWRVMQVEEGGVYEQSTAPTMRGHRVWGAAANDILAIVDSSTWRYDGTIWKSSLAGTPSGEAWHAVWASPGRGFISVGARGAAGHLEKNQSYTDLLGAMRSNIEKVSVAPDQSAWSIIGSTPPIVSRWTSTGWAPAPPLPPTGPNSTLAAVQAFSNDDVWVAGTGREGDGSSPLQNYGFVTHFTRGVWGPIERAAMRTFHGLTAVSATEVWVVGQGGAAHKEGSTWTQFTVPEISFTGVTSRSTTEVWLVGRAVDGEGNNGVVFRWNGGELKEVHRSKLVNGDGIWASGPNDIWVSGQPGAHFDGSSWKRIEESDYFTNSVWGTGPKDVWLLSNSTGEGSIRHWDGTAITTMKSVSPGLYGVSGSGPRDVWIVGAGGATLRYASSPWTTTH